MTAGPGIPFVDLAAQRRHLEGRIEAAIARVLAHGIFIMGPEVATLEKRLAAFAGCGHAVSCSNGTEAMVMVLMAWGVGPGDAVFVPAFTFVATAEAAVLVGATPVFVDVAADDFNLDPDSLEDAVAVAKAVGLNPRVVVPVDLFGQPADYAKIGEVANRHGLAILADAAQSFGGALGNKRVGALATVTTTSFFPAKPLGCYGDGGAIFTDDPALAGLLKSIRVHGHGQDKYDNVRVGLNARLDTIQAAVLLEKLAILEDELAARQAIAERYSAQLGDVVAVPRLGPGRRSAWAQYTVRTARREAIAAACRADTIPTAVYYPIPLHRQGGYAHYPCARGGCPVSERLAVQVISLPMHPYLDEATQDRIVAAVRQGAA